MKCDYCNSDLDVCKYTYKGKTSDGKRKQKTLKFCLSCQAWGISSSKEKIMELWDEVLEHTIERADGMEMCMY